MRTVCQFFNVIKVNYLMTCSTKKISKCCITCYTQYFVFNYIERNGTKFLLMDLTFSYQIFCLLFVYDLTEYFVLEFYATYYFKKLYIRREHIITINMCILILIREGIFTATKCTKKLLKVGLMPVMLYGCKLFCYIFCNDVKSCC